MDYSALRLFLSDENIKMHLEYLNKQRLLYSVLQKSISAPIGDCITEIYKMNLQKDIKNEALFILCNIKSHELFFNSFLGTVPMCKKLKECYGSNEQLIYDVSVMAQEHDFGFIYICLDKNGRPRLLYRVESLDVFINYNPVLAFDLYEHTYFKDYGFNKRKYLENSLRHFNLKLLDDSLLSLDN